jgi:hypothetical protein
MAPVRFTSSVRCHAASGRDDAVAADDAGIVDEDVEPAEGGLRRIHDVDPGTLCGYVLVDIQGATAVAPYSLGQLRAAGIVNIGEDHRGAFLDKQFGLGRTLSSRRSRNDRDLAR